MAKNNKGSGQASIFETSRNPPKIKIKDSQAVIADKLANGYEWVFLDAKTKVLRSPEKLKAS